MRDYSAEYHRRVEYIMERLREAHADGIVFGNSGGKDCALVGILCKAACDNTVGILLPCGSSQNYGRDLEDARTLAAQFGIETRTVDLTAVKEAMLTSLAGSTKMLPASVANIAPRLRMTALYSVAGSENRLVAGTGNRSERYMGYFTKWGDGAFDFDPIADLTVTEVYEFLEYLHAPRCVIDKAPSAGLFEGQTDEQEMGVSYSEIDEFILRGTARPEAQAIIQSFHARNAHKLRLPSVYEEK